MSFLLRDQRRCEGRASLFLLGAVLCLLTVTGVSGQTNVVEHPAGELADLSLADLMKVEVPTVTTASKHEQKATEAPSAVTVITKDDIKKFGYRTLGDILESVRGFYISSDHSYGYVGVRGLDRPGDYGGRVLLLIDGHRLNDPIYDNVAVMHDFILDVDLIERVEVIRGPGSSLYGDNAFFAVVNIITRRGRDVNGTELSGSAGANDSYNARITSGRMLDNGVELLVSGSIYDSAGDPRLAFHFDDPTPHTSIATNLDYEHAYSLFSTVSYGEASVEAAFVQREKQSPAGLYGTVFGDPRFVTTDTRGFLEAREVHKFDAGGELTVRGYYDYYGYIGDYPNPNALNRDDQSVQFTGSEVQWRQTFWEKHQLTVGGEARDVFQLHLANYDIAPQTVYEDINTDSQNYGLYAQDEFQAFSNLILNAGVRFDYYSEFGSTVNPRVALIYNPLETTSVKFIYGTAFRAPNAYEQYYYNSTVPGLPQLQPERITTYELTGEQALGQHLRVTASGFYNQIDRLISQINNTNGTVYFANTDSVEDYGAEAEIDGQWRNGLRGRASYTYTIAQDNDTGEHLDNSPRQLAKFNLLVPIYKDRVTAGFEVQYTGARSTLDGTTLGGYWIENLTLFSQKLVNGWELSASVYNLLDRKYSDPSSSEPDTIPQDGRTWRVKLSYRF